MYSIDRWPVTQHDEICGLSLTHGPIHRWAHISGLQYMSVCFKIEQSQLCNKEEPFLAAFDEEFNQLLLIRTSNDDKPIQVETAACCHCIVDLLSCADLIDTPTEQIKPTFTKGKRQCVSTGNNRNMPRIRGQHVLPTLVLVGSKNIISDLQCLVRKQPFSATYKKHKSQRTLKEKVTSLIPKKCGLN